MKYKNKIAKLNARIKEYKTYMAQKGAHITPGTFTKPGSQKK